MTSEKERRLEQVAETLQRRWGHESLRKLRLPGSVGEHAHLPTGFPALDRALGIGGIPRGRVSDIAGLPTSGVSTLALRLVANAQRVGDSTVWVDLGGTFDADYAQQSGVETGKLLLVRPPDQAVALHIVQDLLAKTSAGIIVVDLSTATSDYFTHSTTDGIRPLIPALDASGCALVFLTRLHQPSTDHDEAAPTGLPLAQHASLRLRMDRVRWLRRRQDVRGYRARITILKNKLAAPGRPITVTLHFPQELP